MKFSYKSAGFTILAGAYLVSAFLVFRHMEQDKGEGRVTIRISQWQLESGVREAINAIIRRYEQINPRVHVVQIAVPGGPIYQSWVLTQMVGGTGPDLAQYNWTNPEIARYFQPITADVKQPNPYNRGTPLEGVPWRDTFIDGMVSPDSFVEELHEYYSVPMDTHFSRIVYNRPLLKAITGSDAPPRTYREMLAVCAAVRAYAKARHLDLVPMANSHDTNLLLCWVMVVSMTGRLSERIDFQHRLKVEAPDVGLSYLRGDWNYDAPEIVAALHELKDYGAMCSPGFWDRERDTAVTEFVNEHAAMIVAPSWEATNLLALSRFDIAAFPFPYPREDDPVFGRYVKGPFSEGQLTTGLPIYVNRDTKHRAEAMDFLHFMTSQEGSSIFTQVSNWPPATVGVTPSKFASQFKIQSEGYCWYGNYIVPTADLDTSNFISNQMAVLWSPNGSVDAFRDVLRAGAGDRIRGDIRHDVSTELDNLRSEDVAAVARVELAPPGHRPDIPSFVPLNPNEAAIYQTQAFLAPPPSATPGPGSPSAADISRSGRTAVRPRPGQAAAGGGPRLAAGWQALADYKAKAALEIFDAGIDATVPAVAREARFGHGIALLDKQPISPAQIDEARRTFAALAESGTDDLASAAEFFLGRIAQHHQAVADPAEAAGHYRQLIAEDPDSTWAQAAVGRLAILEIYQLGLSSAPQDRIARAEELFASAHTPAATSELHVSIANAIFFYRLPAAGALPHLLAAERLGRLDSAARTEVLVQIAELSRLAGDKPQAARFYRTFLRENPIDLRRYIVKERLAAVEK